MAKSKQVASYNTRDQMRLLDTLELKLQKDGCETLCWELSLGPLGKQHMQLSMYPTPIIPSPFLGGGVPDKVSLCSFGTCPGSSSVDQAGLKLTDIWILPLPTKCLD